MNVRAIRVTLIAALRHAPSHEAERCRVRARQLLAEARRNTTAPAVISEIEALRDELDADALGQQLGES